MHNRSRPGPSATHRHHGGQRDRLATTDIRITAVFGAISIVGFALYRLRVKKRALFDIRIFTDRNFAMACLVIALLGLGMVGTIVVQPILLERLLNYPILTTGMIMAPRGSATAISMLISAFGSHWMTKYSLDIGAFWIIWSAMLQGLGMGLIFVPLSTIAYATLPRAHGGSGRPVQPGADDGVGYRDFNRHHADVAPGTGSVE